MIIIYKDENEKSNLTSKGQPQTVRLENVEQLTIEQLAKRLLERDKKAVAVIMSEIKFRFIY